MRAWGVRRPLARKKPAASDPAKTNRPSKRSEHDIVGLGGECSAALQGGELGDVSSHARKVHRCEAREMLALVVDSCDSRSEPKDSCLETLQVAVGARAERRGSSSVFDRPKNAQCTEFGVGIVKQLSGRCRRELAQPCHVCRSRRVWLLQDQAMVFENMSVEWLITSGSRSHSVLQWVPTVHRFKNHRVWI